jgi:queuine/archaeosine tRNA-ribosyltransferase
MAGMRAAIEAGNFETFKQTFAAKRNSRVWCSPRLCS